MNLLSFVSRILLVLILLDALEYVVTFPYPILKLKIEGDFIEPPPKVSGGFSFFLLAPRKHLDKQT